MDPEIRETHSAVVVLLGDRVYKAKKAVRLPFLDFSTVDARRHVAEREVALNRRLAPDVYLGVGWWRPPAPASAEPGEPPGPVGPAEPVVVMRRMPDDRRLATLVGEAGSAALATEVDALARLVAEFHARAERSPEIDAAGHPETVSAKLEADLEETRGVAAGVLDPARVDRVATLARRYLAGRAPLLTARVRAGRIRDGHGDLLADDIFLLDDGPRILDCIEFDDRLRWGDVLADAAFLTMDLERLGAPDLAARFLGEWTRRTGDDHPPSLAHYYVAARALIRAKVTAVRVHQGDRAAAPLAARLLALAEDHLGRGRVTCTLVGGTPGTGKSTLARALAPDLDAVVLSSDGIRKELAGLAADARAEAPYGTGLYDEAHTRATYTELLARARRLLGLGVPVVLDASWTSRAWRDRATETAAATGSDLHALRCTASAGTTERRLAARRAAGGHASDATIDVARTMRDRADPWPEAVEVDTDGALGASVEVARRAVGRSQTRPSSSTATISP